MISVPGRHLAGGILLALALPGLAAAGEGAGPLAERIEGALKRGGLRGARVSILVQDLISGETLYERGADDPLTPASVTKVLTSAAALDALKPQYRFRTAVYGSGRQQGGTWHGDLYLKAWGDPALVEERVWTLVNDLRKRGLRTVEGSLRVDDSFFDRERYGADWGPLSRAWYYSPHGAVSVNYNTLENRGRFVAIDSDPSRHAGRYFADMMRREGIDLTGAVEYPALVPESATLLAASESKPLGEIVSDLNKISNNFIAEQVLKTLGAESEGPPGTAEKGLRAVGAYLRKLGVAPGAFELRDGSGLSHSNRVSARAVVRVLAAMLRDFEVGPEFLASLKVAGVDGKGTRFADPLCRRRMRVKTGHLFGVASLAGFAETIGGRRVVFTILANDYRRGRRAADRGIEDLCEAFLSLGAPEGSLLVRDVLGSQLPPPASEPLVVGPEGIFEDDSDPDEGD